MFKTLNPVLLFWITFFELTFFNKRQSDLAIIVGRRHVIDSDSIAIDQGPAWQSLLLGKLVSFLRMGALLNLSVLVSQVIFVFKVSCVQKDPHLSHYQEAVLTLALLESSSYFFRVTWDVLLYQSLELDFLFWSDVPLIFFAHNQSIISEKIILTYKLEKGISC